MSDIFVFVAANKEAQVNLNKSIRNPIDSHLVFNLFEKDEQDELKEIYNTAGSFYAWGAKPGKRAIPFWNKMKIGDHVLCYYDQKYKYYAKVLGKYHKKELAKEIWGKDENGYTWEYIFFLTKPQEIDIPIKKYEDYLPSVYRGFTRISDDKVNKIAEDYGSLENFINKAILGETSRSSSRPNFWWVNQGKTFEQEYDGGFIWAPRLNDQGRELFHWTNVSKVKVGDILFHYVKGDIVALSIAQTDGYNSTKPDSLPSRHWQSDGWKADLNYYKLVNKVTLDQIASSLYKIKLEKSPLDKNKEVKQGYLFEIDSDAAQIIVNKMEPEDIPQNIKEMFPSLHESKLANKSDIKEIVTRFISYLNVKGYYFKDEEINAFITSIITKPFVILTGNSGSGKTQLAKLFAVWLNSDFENDNARYRIVPVGADWTDNRNVIGFVNHLKTENGNNRPIFQGTSVLDLILRARKDPQRPYFLVLDEMNLSHVERYFSDFLSAMESMEPIPVHEENEELSTSSGFRVSHSIHYPPNLYVIGTVNIDETTYMFSPKVLDRANVLEFRLNEEDLNHYYQQVKNVKSTSVGAGEMAPYGMPQAFQELSKKARELNAESIQAPSDIENIRSTLFNFFRVLKKSGFEFAYRTIDEILRYTRVSHTILPEGQEWNWHKVMDMQILQKILPKLHGSRRRLEATLVALAKLCEQNDSQQALQLFEKNSAQIAEFDENPGSEDQYFFPESRKKLVQMINTLRRDQFVSFIQ